MKSQLKSKNHNVLYSSSGKLFQLDFKNPNDVVRIIIYLKFVYL